MTESNADRIERLTGERDVKKDKIKKEIGYREQTFKCCDTCQHGSCDDECYIYCDLLDEFVPISSICNKYEGGA